jgi:hypothetical protein
MMQPTNPPPPAGAPRATRPTGHEFTDAQNAVIAGLAGPMGLVGVMLVALGLLGAAGAIAGTVVRVRGVMALDAAWEARVRALDEAARAAVARPDTMPVPFIVVAGVLAFVGALLPVALGAWLRSASRSFGRIVTTQGDDVTQLMDAVRELTHVYALGRVMVIYAVAVSTIGLLALLFMARP